MASPTWEQEHFDALASLTAEDFTPLVGTALPLGDGGAVELELRSVEVLPSGYELVFAGPEAPLLEQSMHPVRHPDVGVLPLFLVPGQADDGPPLYIATFT